MSSGYDPESLAVQSKDVFTLISTPFEGEFDAQGFEATLSFPVPPSAPIYTSPKNELYRTLSGAEIDSRDDWKVELGYDPSTNQLGYKRVEIPMLGSDNLALRRSATGNFFIPVLCRDGHDTMLTSDIGISGFMLGVSRAAVEQTMALTNHGLNRIFLDPMSVHLNVAQLIASASKWVVTEKRELPQSERLNVVMQRVSSCEFGDDRDLLKTTLTATVDTYSPKRTERRRMDIVFSAADYEVDDLAITVAHQVVAATLPEVIAVDEPEYVTVETEELPPNAEALELLSEAFVEFLS